MKEIPASVGKCVDHIWSPVEILSCSLLQENWAMLRLAGANTRFNSSYTLSPSSLSLCMCVCVCVCVSSLPLSLSSPPSLYLYLSPPIQQHLLTFPPSATFSLTSFRTQLKRITTINICSTCVSASVSLFFPAPRQCPWHQWFNPSAACLSLIRWQHTYLFGFWHSSSLEPCH